MANLQKILIRSKEECVKLLNNWQSAELGNYYVVDVNSLLDIVHFPVIIVYYYDNDLGGGYDAGVNWKSILVQDFFDEFNRQAPFLHE